MAKEVYEPREDSFLLAKNIPDLKGKIVLDLGTGSGIQAISAFEKNALRVVCADISKKALQKASKNIEKAGFDGFEAVESDLFENIRQKFDAIIFNPPYVASEKIVFKDVDGGKKGREVLDRFLPEAKKFLKKGGKIFFLQSSLNGIRKTQKMLKEHGFTAKIIAGKRLFFEELVVFEATL